MKRFLASLFFPAAFFSATCSYAFDGFYDLSLPLGGRNLIDVSSSSSDRGLQMLVQADGRLLLGGSCAVAAHTFCAARLHIDGSYDTTFGPGGVGKVDFENLTGFPHNLDLVNTSMARMPDGRLLFAGNNGGAVLVAVLNANGNALDTSVGGGAGYFTLPSCDGLQASGEYFSRMYAAMIESDGSVLVAGSGVDASHLPSFAIAKLRSNLTGLDTTFGYGGCLVVEDFYLNINDFAEGWVTALNVQHDGKVILAGFAANSTFSIQAVALVRLLSNGQLDPTFGNAGGTSYSPAPQVSSQTAALPTRVLVDRYGRIVIGGWALKPAGLNWLVDRLLPDGSHDPAFNAGHSQVFMIRASAPNGAQQVSDLVLQSDSKILAAGSVSRDGDGSLQYWGAARLLDDGTFDSNFAGGGTQYGTFAPDPNFGYTDSGWAVSIANGGILIAGEGQIAASGENGDKRFGIAKLTQDLVFADRFE